MTPEQPRNVIDEALSQIAPDAATGATGATRAALFRYSCLHSHSSSVHVLADLELRLDLQQVEEREEVSRRYRGCRAGCS